MTSGKRGNTEWFIKNAIATHGDRYDYSLVNYRGCRAPVTIICKKHGQFEQKPFIHIGGHGCPLCARDGARSKCFGVGVNNAICESKTAANKKWRGMIRRCYDDNYIKDKTSYAICSVCDEWLDYENFKRWFYDPANGYREGYQLDKDIILKGNKVYSPDTCCFVPPEINTMILSGNSHRGKLPIGVTEQKGRFIARMSVRTQNGPQIKHLGGYNTADEAFLAYKRGKEAHIREVAREYYGNNKITRRVYNALCRYQISVSD